MCIYKQQYNISNGLEGNSALKDKQTKFKKIILLNNCGCLILVNVIKINVACTTFPFAGEKSLRQFVFWNKVRHFAANTPDLIYISINKGRVINKCNTC